MRLQPIDKLMVVGHPLSGYASVEQVLHSCGLKPAATSKTQGLSPTQVSDMLMRAYRVQPLTALQALENIKPIIPSPVWQSLALDLLLGNLDQELWGWSDPQAIYLLDYWKNLDHQLAFVLVYESPQASIAGLFDKPDVDCTEEVVQAASANWLAYNEALLNFYLGNTERCLLVHGQQVRAKTADYLRQVQHQMGVELQMPWGGVGGEVKHSAWNALQTELCARVLSANPKMALMYADLQSVASLPQGDVKAKPSFITDMALLSKFVALNRSNLRFQRYVEELKAAKEVQEQQYLAALAEDRQRNIEELRQKEAELLSRVGELDGQLQQAREEVNQHAAVAAAEYVTSNKALEEENELLLLQLHQVQEELVKYYLENEEIRNNEKKQSEEAIQQAIEKVKKHLSYRVGSILVKHGKTPLGWMQIPLEIVRQVKDFRKNQRLNAQQIIKINKK